MIKDEKRTSVTCRIALLISSRKIKIIFGGKCKRWRCFECSDKKQIKKGTIIVPF